MGRHGHKGWGLPSDREKSSFLPAYGHPRRILRPAVQAYPPTALSPRSLSTDEELSGSNYSTRRHPPFLICGISPPCWGYPVLGYLLGRCMFNQDVRAVQLRAPSPSMPGTRSAQYKSFLERLRTARRQAGLTQAHAARRLGRPQSFISKCESGERRVDAVELGGFARLYRKPLTFFLDKGRRI